MYYVNHGTGQSTFDRDDPMIPDNVPEPDPAPAPAPAPVTSYTPTKPATKKQWKIVRAAKIRSGFEQTSTDRGVANIGDIIDEIESRVNARGITRVRYDRGWLSVKAADGGTILQPYSAPRPLPEGWETAVSRSTGRTYYVNHATGQSTFDRDDPMIPAPAPAPAPAPVAAAAKQMSKGEAATRGKFMAMTLTQLRKQCTDSWLSTLGTKQDMVDRLVDYEKPTGGWPAEAPVPATQPPSTKYQ